MHLPALAFLARNGMNATRPVCTRPWSHTRTCANLWLRFARLTVQTSVSTGTKVRNDFVCPRSALFRVQDPNTWIASLYMVSLGFSQPATISIHSNPSRTTSTEAHESGDDFRSPGNVDPLTGRLCMWFACGKRHTV